MKIEVSNGELADKVSILSIKLQRVKDSAKQANIRREYEMLSAAMREAGMSPSDPDFVELMQVNSTLWDIENRIRAKEAAQQFDDEFVALARSVYRNNDRRAAIKRRINLASGSVFVEEKEYHPYT